MHEYELFREGIGQITEDLERIWHQLDQEQRHRMRCPEHLPFDYWQDFTARHHRSLRAAQELIQQAQHALDFESSFDVFMQDNGIHWR